MKKFLTLEWILVVIILLIGLVLRVFHYADLSFTHDELSALIRTEFGSFSELMEFGIKVDGHPPLIQVFLYVWTALFGYKEFIVKLPFLLVGMVSLVMVYKMAKSFTNSWVIALAVLAFFATNQLHISYSTIARMYITCFLFAVAMVYYWWEWLQRYEKKNLILMLVFALLGAYNHHFNTLLALLVWGSGWFYISQEAKKKYLLVPIICFVAYLPIIYISYFQFFVTGGLNWMEAPADGFTESFIAYVFHFQPIYTVFMCIGVALSLVLMPRVRGIVILGVSWFVAVFTISYLYSIHVAPVIQYHLMLFVLPFPIIAATSGWEKFLKGKKFLIITSVILLVNMVTLISTRKHFDLFPNQPYKTLAMETLKISDAKNKTLVITDINLDYLNFYLKDNYKNIDTISVKNLNKLSISKIKKTYDYVLTCGISESMESILTPYFIPIGTSKQGLGYEIDVLKKHKREKKANSSISRMDFTTLTNGWSMDNSPIGDEEKGYYYLKGEEDIWGPNFDISTNNLKSGLLCLEMTYQGDTQKGDMSLAIGVQNEKEERIQTSIEHFEIKTKDAGKVTERVFLDLDLLPKEAKSIKAFHWKRSKTAIDIHSMYVYIVPKAKPRSSITDSIISVRQFNVPMQENWADLPKNQEVKFTKNKQQQYLKLDKTENWFPSYTFQYPQDGVYTMEFEFKAKKLDTLSSIILSVTDSKNNEVFWTEKKLYEFITSNGDWTKATISTSYTTLSVYDEPLTINFLAHKFSGIELEIKNPTIRKHRPNKALYGFIGEITK